MKEIGSNLVQTYESPSEHIYYIEKSIQVNNFI